MVGYFTLGTINGDRVNKDEMGRFIYAMRFLTKTQQYWGLTTCEPLTNLDKVTHRRTIKRIVPPMWCN